MIRILSTKKLQVNQKQFLLNAGFSVVEADFIEITNTAFTFSNIYDNLIFTSTNAVKAVSSHPDVQDIRRKPCFCVGEKTAALLDENGFTVLEIASNAAQLAEAIVSGYNSENFTFLSGSQRLDELPQQLKNAGIDWNETEVYQTKLTPKAINPAVDGILFFSPTAVESYLSANKIANETCFCIGNTTAKALDKVTDKIIIANQPSVENTIIQVINHYKK